MMVEGLHQSPLLQDILQRIRQYPRNIRGRGVIQGPPVQIQKHAEKKSFVKKDISRNQNHTISHEKKHVHKLETKEKNITSNVHNLVNIVPEGSKIAKHDSNKNNQPSAS